MRQETDDARLWARTERGRLADIKVMQILTESEFRHLTEMHGRMFDAGMGAEAVKKIIEQIDLDELSQTLHVEMRQTSGQRRKKAIKRLRLIEAFRKSGARPEWMILSTLPVIPARPATDGAARRRSLRDVRPERPLSPRHQPQQPPQPAPRPRGARDHHPQREADAAGGVRRADRQRPPRPRDRRHRQPSAQEPVATCSRASRAGSARTCSASASTTPDARSSWSAPSSSCTSAACRRRWRSSCSSRSSCGSSSRRASPTTSRAPSASSSACVPRCGTCWRRSSPTIRFC